MHYDNALMNSIKGPSLLNLKNLTPGFVYHVLSASITTQILFDTWQVYLGNVDHCVAGLKKPYA